MARKNSAGRYILAAGEVGAYTVCPEAWRLKMIEHAKTRKDDSTKLGLELHEEWAKNYDEALLLGRGVRFLIALLIITVLITTLL